MLPSNVDEVIISSSSSVCLQSHESWCISKERERLLTCDSSVTNQISSTLNTESLAWLGKSTKFVPLKYRKFSIILKTGQRNNLFYFIKNQFVVMMTSFRALFNGKSTTDRKVHTHELLFFSKKKNWSFVVVLCHKRKGKTEKSSTKRRMAPHVGKNRLLRAT